MSNFEEDMNLEIQLQGAFATIAQLRDQIDALSKLNWSLEERLRISDESKEDLKQFYENQMDNLCAEQQKMLDNAVASITVQITKSFEEKIARLIAERDAALLSAKQGRGKLFGRKSERNAGHKDDDRPEGPGSGTREEEKAGYVDAESQRKKDAEKSATSSDGSTLDDAKLVKRLKRKYPGADISVERVDYSKAAQYMVNDDAVTFHRLEEYFILPEGESFRTGKDGEIEKSYYRIIIRYPERYEEHIYEAAHVRSKEKDEYKTTDILDLDRPVPGCMFSREMLVFILCEKYQYHTPFRQIVKKLRHRGLDIPKSVLGEHVHTAIAWLDAKLRPFWESQVRKSWIMMIDETRTLVGCTDEQTKEREYKNKYMWGIRANSVNLAWFIYENGSRGAEAIRPFLEGFLGFYTTDGYVVYKIFDSKLSSDAAEKGLSDGKGRRSACLVHIRRKFVDAILENKQEAMWFIDEICKMFSIEYQCRKKGLTGHDRLIERLKKGSTADIMKRIEERLEVFRQSGYAGCGEMLTNALKYATDEWPAMQRVLECGDVELSNNLSEQMMRSIKTNLKNAGNIGSEESAKHNAFMFSVIESCKMSRRVVEDYLMLLLDKLRKAQPGDDLTRCLPCYLTA